MAYIKSIHITGVISSS